MRQANVERALRASDDVRACGPHSKRAIRGRSTLEGPCGIRDQAPGAAGPAAIDDAGALPARKMSEGLPMVEKLLVHRRAVLQGAIGLATAGVAGLPPAPALAQAAQGVTDNEILIGALGQLTGPFAFIGAPGRDNIQMAMEHLNAAGGINGRK